MYQLPLHFEKNLIILIKGELSKHCLQLMEKIPMCA